MAFYQSRKTAERIAERIKIFAQTQRLVILSYLLSGEHTVSDIETATGIGQPALSQQLAELRRAELVTTRRASKQIHYQLADETIARWIETIEAFFGENVADTSPHRPKRHGETPTMNSGASVFAYIEEK